MTVRRVAVLAAIATLATISSASAGCGCGPRGLFTQTYADEAPAYAYGPAHAEVTSQTYVYPQFAPATEGYAPAYAGYGAHRHHHAHRHAMHHRTMHHRAMTAAPHAPSYRRTAQRTWMRHHPRATPHRGY